MMAGHEWEDWFEREEFIGQISDIRVQNLQVEREEVQKRTFTRWMNLHLEKCDPPIEVHDLFHDIQDGRILMALLEELSGCKLLQGYKKSSHRIFRLNNIAKVLSFLEERNVKLVSIDATDVADGNSSIVLGLIWNIILFFQIKELTGNIRSQFPSSSSLSSIPTSSDSDTSLCSTPSDDRQLLSMAIKEQSKAIKKLLQWVQKRTRKYGVAVQDFGKSWTSGLAFLAVIKSIDTSQVDMRKALLRNARENLEDAFRIAHYSLGIPRLLEPEDLTINTPDEQSIITYVAQFLEYFPGMEEPEEPCQLIERSVSMGRLNFRDSDADRARNDPHQSRVKERSYRFQGDYVPPPPKILISSVSEDKSATSTRFTPAAARSWSTEDFLSDSPHMETISSHVVEDTKEPIIEDKLSYTQSTTSSSVPECVNTDSVLGDSAVSSPESWIESDFGAMSERFCESQSDISLCDSGTVWDVYHAIPVDVTPHDEGFVPSLDDRDADEQSYEHNETDSKASVGRTQELSEGDSEKKEKEGEVLTKTEANQDVVRDQINDELTEEADAQEKDERLEPSSELYVWPDVLVNTGAHPLEMENTNQSGLDLNDDLPIPDHFGELTKQTSVEESTYKEHECLRELVDSFVDAQGHEGPMNVQNENVKVSEEEAAVETECRKTDYPSGEDRDDRDDSRLKLEKDEGVLETSQEVLVYRLHLQENSLTDRDGTLLNTNTTKQEGAPSIPLISISTEPEEEEEEESEEKACDKDGQAQTGGEEMHQPETTGLGGTDPDVSVSHNSSELNGDSSHDDHRNPVEMSWHLDDANEPSLMNSSNPDTSIPFTMDNMEIGEPNQECQHLQDTCETDATDKELTGWTLSSHDTSQPLNTDQDSRDTVSTKTQQSLFNPVESELTERTGILCHETDNESKNVDFLYADFDRSSPAEDVVDLIEPMDLFYPDKEELQFTEPLYTEMQSWPSVLSVSALEPAPASETLLDDQPLTLLCEDWRNGVDLMQDKVITGINQESHELLHGEKIRGPWGDGVPADHSDVSETEQQSSGSAVENTEPLRSDVDRPSQREDVDSLIPTVLRHRKRASLTESADCQRAVTAATRRADEADTVCWSDSSELYLILLLWLLLYCFWLLPQLDLKTLPSLLLNFNH
ncbi:calmin isoform X1 [Solea senegalensis]|uniref:Calmin n=1 Tax=Solea senegalensis TaxID=28829 RepID=A0AAV6S1R6_SOLSE|nr:interaptin isoform X2 [Solea senegalensis]KAG7510495.1 calmin isoform X1 [Solea senegalensis]